MAENILKDTFGKVEGLDVDEGMSHLMNMESIYVKIMKQSVSNIEEQLTKVKEGYQTLPPADLRIHYHSLKGIFANIAVKSLQEQSLALEKAASGEDSGYIQENTPAYIATVEKFLQEFLQAIELYDKLASE